LDESTVFIFRTLKEWVLVSTKCEEKSQKEKAAMFAQ
jgi:hypothetical protein